MLFFSKIASGVAERIIAPSHGAVPDPAIILGYDHFSGMNIFDGEGLCGPRIKVSVRVRIPNGFPRPKMKLHSFFFGMCCPSGNPGALVHPAAKLYRDAYGSKWPILLNAHPAAKGFEDTNQFPVQPTRSGMTISGELSAKAQTDSGLYGVVDPGDLIQHDATGNFYIVTSVTSVGHTNGRNRA